MFDSFEKITLGPEADSKISLYRLREDYYLVRHFPIGFAKLTKEYARELERMFSPHNNRKAARDEGSDISQKLAVFIDAGVKAPSIENSLRRLNLLVAQGIGVYQPCPSGGNSDGEGMADRPF
jgi:hypothetical protein